MPVDPWRGMNEGLAALNDTFDTMENRRVKDAEMARQARIDALQEPILKAQGESAVVDLEEKRRKISDLRAYDAARKDLEANPGTVPTITEYTPPGSMTGLDAIKDRIRQGPTRMADVGEGLPAEVPNTGMLPEQGLPTQQVAGTRPPNPSEMASKRMMLAVQNGQYDEVAKIGTVLDITDKIQGNESAKLAKMVANAKANRQVMGPEAALIQLKREATAAGIPPQIVDAIKLNRDGIISYPDGQGGILAIVETPDGKYEVKHVTAKEPKSPTQIDIETRAAQGDKLAIKILADQEDRKGRIADRNAARKINVNGLTPEENSALTKAIDENRLDSGRVNSRTAKIFAQMELDTPGMNYAGKSADISANRKSLEFQQKNRDMMSSFVANIGKQVDRVREATKSLERYDTRLLNVPLVEARKKIAGDPRESVLAMYLTEISNEAARLSAGNATSIAEMSEGAQRKWAAIHDDKLSVKDMLTLLEETKHAGVMRLQTVEDTLKESQGRMDRSTRTRGGSPSAPQTAPAGPPAGAVPVPGKVSKAGKPVFKLPNGKYWAED